MVIQKITDVESFQLKFRIIICILKVVLFFNHLFGRDY